VIELRNVSKIFGQRPAVSDLSLTVPRGEIYGLLGHNGAGKSTAIGMMLGQVWPSGGEVLVCGHNVQNDRQRALARVGAIFEAPVFYDYLSGYRNLEVLSYYSGPTPAKRLREVLDWVGLTGREKSKVRTYSHGMRARLAIAQALLPDPELLILDEPSDGLDPEGIHEMRETIIRLQRELNLTILLSSHLLNEVEQLCTRIAVMNQGRKVFEGTIAEATRKHNWVRLLTDDFTRAVAGLHEAGIVARNHAGRLIALAPGQSTAVAVRWLVEHGFPVHEISPEEETLESFYLSLMDEQRARMPQLRLPPKSNDA
jgi:ABC-2 type transport system ATP-binding protein